tara:strand:+ start:695 stop:859 length:165 start_codon:yes stop_codon:yes gene_type:complete
MKPNEVKQLREDLKLTQQELAYMLQVAPMTVSRWETGNSKPSRIFTTMMLKMNK